MHNRKKKERFPPWPQLFIFIFTWQTLERISIWSIHECLGGKNGSQIDSYWDIVIIHGNHNHLDDILFLLFCVWAALWVYGMERTKIRLSETVSFRMTCEKGCHSVHGTWCISDEGREGCSCFISGRMACSQWSQVLQEHFFLNMNGNMACLWPWSTVTALHRPVFG